MVNMTDRVNEAFWIWCRFCKSDTQKLNSLKDNVAANLIGPPFDIHLTLIGPFASFKNQEKKSIEKIAKAQSPFYVQLTNIKIEPEIYTSFYVGVKNSQTLFRLRERMCRVAPLLADPKFQPHISLVYGQFSNNDKLKTIDALGQIPDKVLINKLSVVYVNEIESKWDIQHDFTLGS